MRTKRVIEAPTNSKEAEPPTPEPKKKESEQRELILFLNSETLKKKLGLPMDAVIISIYEQTWWMQPRQFCFRYSIKE